VGLPPVVSRLDIDWFKKNLERAHERKQKMWSMVRSKGFSLTVGCCLGLLVTGWVRGQADSGTAEDKPTTIPVVLNLKRPTDTDILKLHNGDQLTGTILNKNLSIRTAYAEISLDSRIIAGVDLEGGADNIEAIVTVNNNRFSGFIDDAAFTFKLQGGPTIQIRREKVSKAIFRVREQEREGIPERQFLVLKNGDFFSGKVNNDSLSVATTYAKIPVDLSQVDKISFTGDKNVLTKITMTNGDIVQGILETEDIDLSLDVGGEANIYEDRIDTLYCKAGYVPPAYLGAATLADDTWAKTLALDLGDGVGMKFVLIPAGELTMDSPGGDPGQRARTPGRRQQRRVRLSRPFYMLATEVTQRQYSLIMDTNPSDFKDDDNPVEMVSWNEAMEFCRKLSAKTGKQISLPTEARWEYACRAGTSTRFSMGDDEGPLGLYCWYAANSDKQTHPVGQKKPNAWGLYDMHGNVWEWCTDWYGSGYHPRGDGPSTDSKDSPNATYRVLRGGSWYNDPVDCQSASRVRYAPEDRDNSIGFRVVLDLR
jgi:formylglycine-generating enzyme required for sulfatase activity